MALNQGSVFPENLTERVGGGPGPVGRTARAAELMQIKRIRIIKYAVYVAIGHPATSTEQCNKRINYYFPNEYCRRHDEKTISVEDLPVADIPQSNDF